MSSACAINSQSTTDRARVLIVDDEYGPRESIAYALRRKIDVDTASSAEESFALVTASEYSVVILDISMPDIDGLEALDRIRDLDTDVSVVMLTGYGTLQTAQEAIRGGANLFLNKPPRLVELMDSVAQQAEITRKKRREAQRNAEAHELSAKLKREIEEVSPQLWQGRASVELVHDLTNPLTVVSGYSELIGWEARKLKKVDASSATKIGKYSDVVDRAAKYCNHLADNWRNITREIRDFERVELVELIEEVKQVSFFGNAGIVIESVGPQYVRGSKMDLARVFQNFVRNALEAEADKIRISLTRVANRIEVLVADNGCGMDEETLAKVFNGGYSSKEQGLGVGFSICRHVLGSHGAEFDLKSKPGEGSRVAMVFPAPDAADSSDAEPTRNKE